MIITAKLKTSKGDINIDLFPKQTPVTVASFINLAGKSYYDGLNFHRVIPNFMIQGGCPFGTGTGDPGYKFEDEFDASLRHDTAGRLSMANSGPGTNGSQFFITHGPAPHLDNVHSIFGVVSGANDQTIVDSIAQGDTIITITIAGDTDELLAGQKDNLARWDKAAT